MNLLIASGDSNYDSISRQICTLRCYVTPESANNKAILDPLWVAIYTRHSSGRMSHEQKCLMFVYIESYLDYYVKLDIRILTVVYF